LLARLFPALLWCAASAAGQGAPPLSIELVRPVYRQNIYATEPAPEIVFRVRAAGPALPEATVRYRLTGPAGRSIARGEAPLAAAGEGLRIDAAALAEGKYTLSVECRTAAGVIARKEIAIRKLPRPPGSEVRIDRNGNLLVDGRPRLFLGWYGTVPVDDPRPGVVALQDLQTPVVLDQFPETSPVSEPFGKHGIMSIVSVETGRLQYTFQLWRKPGNTVAGEHQRLSAPSDECRGYLRQLVERLRDQRGLLGWYLADEPEINSYRADYLENTYRLLQELDPHHPVFITNDMQEGIETHGYRACDVLNPDPYSPVADHVPAFLHKAASVMRPGQALFLTPWQSARHTHFTDDFGAGPPYPYRVTRGQYLAAVAAGCRGFTGYTSFFFLPEPILRFGLPHIWREMRFLEAAILAPPPAGPPQTNAAGDTLVWLRRARGHVYLVAMRFHAGANPVVIRHPLLDAADRLAVVAEGREVAVSNAALRDPFEVGDARIYTTDPAGRRLPRLADVESEIDRAAAASVRPGNLLHASLGVRAHVSGGTIPWFSQCYYYAINGQTDDDGWHVTHAPLPQWIELTLPREAEIGSVVLYTPNLRDYDLEFRTADGTTRIARVRGNAAAVARHALRPPAPTLKLRLTARAVRQGASPPMAMVREIEAYTSPAGGTPTEVESIDGAGPPAAAGEGCPPFPLGRANFKPLWHEDFTHFQHAEHFLPGGDAWVFNPREFRAEPQAGGGIVCQSLSAVGYASMARYFPYDARNRFLQVRIGSIEGEGYRFATVGLSDGSGRLKCRGAINTSRPGLYTVDTHALHESYRKGEQKQCFISVYAGGSTKQADGSVRPGPQFRFEGLRLVPLPRNGLAVTLSDCSPLPEKLKPGDDLCFRLLLEKPAADAVVEVFVDAHYAPFPLNGRPYVQLYRAGPQADGRQWAARLRLDDQTGKYASGGYPVLMRAVITGGAIRHTFASPFVGFP
jgi:hypothetical protein